MRIPGITLAIALLTLFSCDSSQYSGEEEAKIEEAIMLHNEAMAIFSDTRPLLNELTEARSELERRTGLSIGDTVSPQAVKAGEDREIDQNNNAQSDSAAQASEPMENIPAVEDTTAAKAVREALTNINEAQNDLLLWMRSIYKVPGYNGIYEDEKTPEGAETSTHKDYDARMLLTDMKFVEMPADASVDEIYEKQKEMKDEILRIQVEIKRAVENARTAYLNYN